MRGELSVCDLSSPAFWSLKTILCPPPLSFEIDSLYMAQAGLELVTIPLKSPVTEVTSVCLHTQLQRNTSFNELLIQYLLRTDLC